MPELERVLKEAEALVALLRDPRPGLFTWQEMVAKARAEIARDL